MSAAIKEGKVLYISISKYPRELPFAAGLKMNDW